ncbi:dihydroxyacetone kinase phosphoryl donor subunit DhaM [Macrococcus sp. DPC7161]|uniref:dihydroxyacetone kinase phosphoryl donor subunit DhaM n=1 Tax=Macrococcus sp. DPC7161 TaxID=2507060 RepID=UPI00100B500D|nr:dihydroxyacetone kinase phosphoryl donor subunit DhaM [Macrococcus sp. DPC7161]RXK18640.1 PTS-dependent dihydroxyacetone kinase phosphotransferase subunit DhaM [Macrococcus sp. DPC7161]
MTTLCIVSHSEKLANGLNDLLREMTNDVSIQVCGGIEGNIGTSIDDITKMFESVEEALVFYDIGSSRMNVEMAIELNDYQHITVAHYPIVEGSFIAAVELSLGKTVDEVMDTLSNNFKEK